MENRPHLLIACALKKEAKGLRKHLKPQQQLLVTGMGVDRTLHTLEEAFETNPPILLLFTGMAGQLDPNLEVGDFVFPRVWGYESGTEFETEGVLTDVLNENHWTVRGKGLTVRRPVVREKDRLRLFRETGARICDMECSAAMMISQSYGIPCLAPKIVSDTADSGMLAFYREFGTNIELLGGYITRLVTTLEENIPLLWDAGSCSPNR